MVLILLSGRGEAGAGAAESVQKLESAAAGDRNKSLSLLLPLVLPLVHSTLRTQWELVGKGETVVCRVPAPASQSGVWKGEYRAETLA